ncbi:MAG TPA: response regulator [Hypericibacter adhaerens]|jgi:two-component system OmpR family response regulator|uniref:Regulatory protein VirG n=1 Tax=Hypericibacter adhaerens TaxID=2602016 RepID=A0A5J6MWU8_9PROT|nr:response regulator [Hypericibacter adhaerens]QEX22202.1 DNA-binding response regulator [Hypericibacter adhaerens]HWA45347.1 response regulator [Hypericibacter adhaerens]
MSRSNHILVVDDDREIRSLVARFLEQHKFRVTAVADGRSMLQALGASRIDLIVLDLMLPGEDGLTLCRRVRAKASTPIIILTAIGGETDRIIGLELGADDYLAKPFNPRELLARIRAVLRRSAALPAGGRQRGTRYQFDGWRFDVTRRELTSPDDLVVHLSAAEFELLTAFVERPQMVLTRDQLLDLTQGRSSAPFDRSVDVLVSRLRRKIERDSQQPVMIKTVRNGGYVFTPKVEAEGAVLPPALPEDETE